MTLYRPVGEKELALIRDSDYRAFPPRLPEQPIFYPVLNQRYAEEIARRWNTADKNSGHKGYVTQFEIDDAYISHYEGHTVGASYHQEYWIPAEELGAFNGQIIGQIRVIAEFGGGTKHTHLVQALIARYQNDLNEIAPPGAERASVCWQAGYDDTFGTYDLNHTNRYRILNAIRFSAYHAPYEELVRFLFAEEIKALESNSFQGFGDPLNLAAWLMKQFKQPEDEELFQRAKNANFDTYCGFGLDVLDKMGFERGLEEWDVEQCLWFAIDLREPECAEELLSLWKAQQTQWDKKTLQSLRSLERGMKHPAGELFALQKLFELEHKTLNDWDYCVALQNIAALQIKLAQTEQAYETLAAILPRLENISEWQSVGLGQFIIERCMEVILLGHPQSTKLWQWARPHIKAMKNMHWNLYEKAAQAAKCMGDARLAENLMRRLKKEQKRLGVKRPGQGK